MKKYGVEKYNYYLQLDGFKKFERIFVMKENPEYNVYSLYHNCDPGSSRLSIYSVSMVDFKVSENYVNITEEGFDALWYFFSRYIHDLDIHAYANPIKIPSMVLLIEDIWNLIDALRNNEVTSLIVKEYTQSPVFIEYKKGESRLDALLREKDLIIDFLDAFTWYVIKHFCISNSNDEDILNIYGF